jgi:hypothetical protein
MKSRYLLAVVLLCLVLWQASPSFAASYDFTAITHIVSNCSSTITITADLYYAGVNADVGAPDRDIVAIIIVDAQDQQIAGANSWITVGASATVNYTFIPLPIIAAPSQRPFSIRVYDVTAAAPTYAIAKLSPLLDVITFDPADFGVCTSIPYASSAESADGPTFTDGRINNWDTGNPVVVYGHDGETGRGLVIYSPDGELLLVVSSDEIEAVGNCPAENTLIASAGKVELYRLRDCRYQLNAPSLDGTKTYVLIFNDLYENTGYSSHEE